MSALLANLNSKLQKSGSPSSTNSKKTSFGKNRKFKNETRESLFGERNSDQEKTNQESNNNTTIIIVVIVIIVLGAIGAGVYFGVIKKKKKDSSKNTVEETEDETATINNNAETEENKDETTVQEPSDELSQNNTSLNNEASNLNAQVAESSLNMTAINQTNQKSNQISDQVSDQVSDQSLNETSVNAVQSKLDPTIFKDGHEVYSTNRNIWSYDDAEAVCKIQGAELASYEHLVEAAENGAHWCNLGWVKSDTTDDSDSLRFAHYPIQKKEFDKTKSSAKNKNTCGMFWNEKYNNKEFSVQGGAYGKNNLLAVNCYGPKRKMKIDERAMLNSMSDNVNNSELQSRIDSIQDKADNLMFLPYNKKQWARLNPPS